MFGGWSLVPVSAALVAARVWVILATYGLNEDGLRVALRATARTSVLLFLLAFLAQPMRRLRRNPFTAWVLRNRRYLGVSFAASHTIHLGVIVALTRSTGESTDPVTLYAAGLGYLLLAAMTATSFDRTAAWLGRVWWKRLHLTGLYYLWFIFLLQYFGTARGDPLAALLSAVLIAALLVRLWVLRQHHAVRDGVVG